MYNVPPSRVTVVIFQTSRSVSVCACVRACLRIHKHCSSRQKLRLKLNIAVFIRGPFEKFLDSPNYSESELCEGAGTVSFSKYIPWQAIHFLQRSTHFSKTCCRLFATSFRRIVEQAVLTFHIHFSISKALP